MPLKKATKRQKKNSICSVIVEQIVGVFAMTLNARNDNLLGGNLESCLCLFFALHENIQ